jgi:hypothetical protein
LITKKEKEEKEREEEIMIIYDHITIHIKYQQGIK